MVFNIRIVCVQLLMFLLITVNGQPYSFFMNPLMRFGRGLEQLRDVKQEISNQLQSKLRDSNLDYYYSVDGASNEEDMLQEQSKVQMRDADQPRVFFNPNGFNCFFSIIFLLIRMSFVVVELTMLLALFICKIF